MASGTGPATWTVLELRFTMAVKAQGDVAQLAQVLFSDLADGGHRVALFAKLQLCPRLQRASKLAVVVNKAVLFDIRRGALAEGDQHLLFQRHRRAGADVRNGGLVNHSHLQEPLTGK